MRLPPLLLLCFAWPAVAEELSLEAAVQETLARHPLMSAAHEGVQEAKAEVARSESAWQPRATVEAGYRYAGPLAELNIDTGITPPGASAPLAIEREMGTVHNAQLGLKVGWRAYDFGARALRVDAAEAMARAAALTGEERAAELAFAVRQAYLGALLFEQMGAVTTRSLETATQELADARLRQEAGVGDSLAVASTETRVAELTARAVALKASAEQAQATLSLLVGREVALGEGLEAVVVPEVESTWVHPTLVKLDEVKEATRLQEDAIARGAWPTLDTFAQAAYQYPKSLFETEFGPTYAAGLNLSWELYDGAFRASQQAALKAKGRGLAADRQAISEERTRKLKEAAHKGETAQATLAAANRAVASAEIYLEAAKTALDAGTGTALEHQRAEEAVERARLMVLQAHYDGALARAEALKAAGMASCGGRTQR